MIYALLISSLHWGASYIYPQWLMALILCACYLWWKLRGVYGVPATTFGLWYVILSLRNFAAEANPFFKIEIVRAWTSECSMIGIVCVTFLALTISEMKVKHGVIATFTVLNAAYTIIGAIFGFGYLGNGYGASGFFDYCGLNGVFLALGVPFLLQHSNKVKRASTLLFVLIAIILCKSTMPFIVLTTCLGGYFVKHNKWFLSPAVILVLAAGYLTVGHHMIEDSGRFAAWQKFMMWWWNNPYVSRWTGFGGGSFQALSQMVSVDIGFGLRANGSREWWAWLHSDLLQTVWETGIVGGVLLLWTIIDTGIRAKSPQIFSLFCGLLVATAVDYPLRYAYGAFLVLYCLKEANVRTHRLAHKAR